MEQRNSRVSEIRTEFSVSGCLSAGINVRKNAVDWRQGKCYTFAIKSVAR